jgi:membrane protein implicated in regulation of membrane protease activity
MGLQERLFDHPLLLLMGCFVWIPVAIWIVALVQWMVVGDVDVLFAVTGIAIALGLGMMTLVPPRDDFAPFAFAAALVTVFAYPWVRRTLDRRELDQIDIDSIERSYELLERRPDDPAALLKLARLLYDRGLAPEAIALTKRALEPMPRRLFEEDHQVLAKWLRAVHPEELKRTLPCVECGLANVAGEVYCARCGTHHLLDHARGRWVGRDTARKLIAAWISMMILILGIPVATASLGAPAAWTIVLGLLVVSVGILLLAFRTSPKGARV